MRILVIDDEVTLRRSIRLRLEDADYDVIEAANGREGLARLGAAAAGFDVVITDLNMPVMDGYAFIAEAISRYSEMPIVVLSGVGVVEDALRAIRMGAWDFITKPIVDFAILDHILDKVLDRARLIRENREYREHLERLVAYRTAELEETRRQIMQRLSRAAEYKDNETGMHVVRVGTISRILGRAMGLDAHVCELLGECAPLHDVGKIGIPDAILLKPGPLDAAEWEVMRRHCVYGCEILGPLSSTAEARRTCSDPALILESKDNELLQLGRVLALCHHERWDGRGYPLGLAGEAIPLEARIVALVDVFDALVNERPYKPAMPLEACLDILRAGSGSQFDPQVVRAFFERLDEIVEVTHRLR